MYENVLEHRPSRKFTRTFAQVTFSPAMHEKWSPTYMVNGSRSLSEIKLVERRGSQNGSI